MLATEWLLRDRGAREVELRIARSNRDGQRVATKAGYRVVGAACDGVKATGQTYDDLRYVSDVAERGVTHSVLVQPQVSDAVRDDVSAVQLREEPL